MNYKFFYKIGLNFRIAIQINKKATLTKLFEDFNCIDVSFLLLYMLFQIQKY